MNTGRTSGVRRVIADLLELVELQCRLFAIDGKEAVRRVLFSAALAIGAGTIAISAITVALMGLGWVFVDAFGWPVSVSLLLAAAIGIVLMLAVLVAAYASLRRAASAMRESGAEFAENIQWFRETLRAGDDGRAYSSGIPEVSGRSRF